MKSTAARRAFIAAEAPKLRPYARSERDARFLAAAAWDKAQREGRELSSTQRFLVAAFGLGARQRGAA